MKATEEIFSMLPAFKENDFPTIGTELELQLVDLQNFNLGMEAKDFLRRLSEVEHPGKVIPEITQSMIELNSSVHNSHASLVTELRNLRDILANEAYQAHIGICGGGTHPFQKWSEQRIYPTKRFVGVSENYGYLAKQFTVFGQHIHVAVPNGDDALYVCHGMARYIPQFIALSAASPFQQGVDTSFDCSRLAVISAFPLSGTPPWLLSWREFEDYFQKFHEMGIVKSMKDFYWDIRPKPEFGTVELRICDTPLTVQKAADLTGFAQLLVKWLLEKRPNLSQDIYSTYLINRFSGARYGLDAILIDPIAGLHVPLAEDILSTCDFLEEYANQLHCQFALQQIRKAAQMRDNDAVWLRRCFMDYKSLNDMVRGQTEIWRE